MKSVLQGLLKKRLVPMEHCIAKVSRICKFQEKHCITVLIEQYHIFQYSNIYNKFYNLGEEKLQFVHGP